jgi:kynureninase
VSIRDAVGGMGGGALSEELLRQHVFPLFGKVLARPGIYMANHSLGRPLDRTQEDLREGFALWQERLGDVWDGWMEEEQAHRARIARLIGAPRADCVVPKTSAGQGLRTVLNALPGVPRVVSTTGEFDSVDVILKQYRAIGRIALETVECGGGAGIELGRLMDVVGRGCELVVISQVMFMTGEVTAGLAELAEACHRVGARLLVDVYHAVGVIPVDVAGMGADFAIGGCYKYLRGGPGACYLYLSPDALGSGLKPLDVGWFGKAEPFRYERPDPPAFAKGGDAFLESTPPVLTYYQARAGQQFMESIGVERMRAYCMDRLARLKGYLGEAGVRAEGGDGRHGAFLTVRHPEATEMARRLEGRGVTTDARGEWLRLCPDCLTTGEEMRRVAAAVSEVMGRSR